MKRGTDTKIPEFQSLEEEREYWEARGPLAEGQKGRINKPKPGQKHSSFLSIRLTGDELTQLRDMAAKCGMGPSTYARQILKLTIEQEHLGMHYPSFLPPSLLFPSLYDSTVLSDEKVRNRICIFDPDEMEVDPATMHAMLNALFKACRATVVTPEDADYNAVQRIVKARR